MNNAQPTITITLERIADFIEEAKDHNIKRVYRQTSDRSGFVRYSAWDPERKTLIAAMLHFPAIAELNSLNTGDRYSRGFNYDEEDTAVVTTSSKQKFVHILKGLNVAKDVLSEFRSVKVEQIYRMIDESAIAETGDRSITLQENGGFYERELECEAVLGLAKKVKIHISRTPHEVSYRVRIEGWNKVFDAVCLHYETAFEKSKMLVVPGSVDTK